MAVFNAKAILIAGIPASTSVVATAMQGRGYAIERVGTVDDVLERVQDLAPQMILIAASLIPKYGRQALLAQLRTLDKSALIVFESPLEPALA